MLTAMKMMTLGLAMQVAGMTSTQTSRNQIAALTVVELTLDQALPRGQQVWDVPVETTQAGAEVSSRPVPHLKLETKPAKPEPMLLQRVEIDGNEQD